MKWRKVGYDEAVLSDTRIFSRVHVTKPPCREQHAVSLKASAPPKNGSNHHDHNLTVVLRRKTNAISWLFKEFSSNILFPMDHFEICQTVETNCTLFLLAFFLCKELKYWLVEADYFVIACDTYVVVAWPLKPLPDPANKTARRLASSYELSRSAGGKSGVILEKSPKQQIAFKSSVGHVSDTPLEFYIRTFEFPYLSAKYSR